MADFDPDAYLAGGTGTTTSFDPDAYLADAPPAGDLPPLLPEDTTTPAPPVRANALPLDFIKGLEGWNPDAYGDYKQLSIGYGTRAKQKGERIDKAEGERRLTSELEGHAKHVDQAAQQLGLKLTTGQRDALISFDFNTGSAAKVMESKDPDQMAARMMQYTKAGGKFLPGLANRRYAEAVRFFEADPAPPEAEFDPDAYLASKPAFDPDQYLADKGDRMWQENTRAASQARLRMQTEPEGMGVLDPQELPALEQRPVPQVGGEANAIAKAQTAKPIYEAAKQLVYRGGAMAQTLWHNQLQAFHDQGFTDREIEARMRDLETLEFSRGRLAGKLEDGMVVVSPMLALDESAWNAAANGVAGATEEAKAAARASRYWLREDLAEKLVPYLEYTGKWKEFRAQRNPDPERPTETAGETLEAFRRQYGGALDNLATQTGIGLEQGGAGIRKAIGGIGAMFGSDAAREMGNLAQEDEQGLAQVAEALSGGAWLSRFSATAMGTAPMFVAGPGGLSGLATAAGVQTGGGTYIDARQAGYSPAASWGLALLQGGLERKITMAFGPTGIEAVAGEKSGEGLMTRFLKGGLEEVPEEMAATMAQYPGQEIISPGGDLVSDLGETMWQSFLLGGGMKAAQGRVKPATVAPDQEMTTAEDLDPAAMESVFGEAAVPAPAPAPEPVITPDPAQEPEAPIATETPAPEATPEAEPESVVSREWAQRHSFPAGLLDYVTPQEATRLDAIPTPGSRQHIAALQSLMNEAGSRKKAQAAPAENPASEPQITTDAELEAAQALQAEHGQVSTALLQRKMKVGFTRAQELVTRLQAAPAFDPEQYLASQPSPTPEELQRRRDQQAQREGVRLARATDLEQRLNSRDRNVREKAEREMLFNAGIQTGNSAQHPEMVGKLRDELRTHIADADAAMEERLAIDSESLMEEPVGVPDVDEMIPFFQQRPSGPLQGAQAVYDAAQEMLDDLGVAAELEVVDSLDLVHDATARGLAQAARQRGNRVEAFLSSPAGRPRITLNASEVTTAERARGLVLHEIVGHHGLEQLFAKQPAEWTKFADRYWYFLKSAQFHGKMRQQLGYSSMQELAELYGFEAGTPEGQHRLVEEHLARLAEQDARPSWWSQMIGHLKEALRKVSKGQWFRSITDADVVRLLARARRAVDGRSAGARTRFSQSPELTKWFGASRITTPDGQPRVMYHGTQRSEPPTGRAYFTDNPAIAKAYPQGRGAQSVRAMYLRVENPLELPTQPDAAEAQLRKVAGSRLVDAVGRAEPIFAYLDNPAIRRAVESAGYDGVIFQDLAPQTLDPHLAVLVFDAAAQTKPARPTTRPNAPRFSQREQTEKAEREARSVERAFVANAKDLKEYQTQRKMKADPKIDDAIKQGLNGMYAVYSDEAALRDARAWIVKEGPDAVEAIIIDKTGLDKRDVAAAKQLLQRHSVTDNHERFRTLANAVMGKQNTQAQALQAMRLLMDTTTPEGAVIYVAKEVTKAVQAAVSADPDKAQLVEEIDKLRKELDKMRADVASGRVIEAQRIIDESTNLTPDRKRELNIKLRQVLTEDDGRNTNTVTRLRSLLEAAGVEKDKAGKLAKQIIDQFRKKVRRARARWMEQLAKSVRINKAMVDALAEDWTSRDVAAAQRGARGQTLWDAYRQQIAGRLASALVNKGQSSTPGLQEFSSRLMSELRNSMPADALPPRNGGQQMDAAAIIREALANPEKYAEAWETAKAEIATRFKHSPSEWTRIWNALNNTLADYSPATLERATKDAMEKIGSDFRHLLVALPEEKAETIRLLTQFVIDETGANAEQATTMATRMQTHIQAALDLERRRLAKQFGAVPKPIIPESLIRKWEKLNNSGLLDDTQVFSDIATKFGFPIFTTTDAGIVKGMVARYQAAPEAELKLVEAARLLEWVEQKTAPAGAWEKVAAFYKLSKLTSFKTAERNIIGNFFGTLGDAAADVLIWPLKKGYSVLTGKTTETSFALANLIRGNLEAKRIYDMGRNFAVSQGATTKEARHAGFETLLTAARLHTSGVRDPEAIRKVHRSVFTSKAGKMFEKIMGAMLSLPDIGRFYGEVSASLAKQMKANGGVTLPTAEMYELAYLAGQKAIYQDKNPLTEGLANIARGLNQLTKPLTGTDKFGLGTVILPFVTVPVNILKEGATWSPLGFVRALYNLVGMHRVNDETGLPYNSGDHALRSLVKASIGTGGLVPLGAWLYGLGIIMGALDDDPEIAAQQRQAGWQAYSINLSMLKRRMLSGNWHTFEEGEKGDAIHSFGWAQPLAFPLAIGARRAQAQEKASTPAAWWEKYGSLPAGAGLAAFVDQPMVTGLSNFARDLQLAKQTGDYAYLARVPVRALDFVPAIVRDLRYLGNNVLPETRSADILAGELSRIVGGIPFVDLPARYNTLGEAEERYQSGTNSFFNVLFNPATTTYIKESPTGDEILRLWHETGDTKQAPVKVGKTVQINTTGRSGQSQRLELSNQDISRLQQLTGKLTVRLFEMQIANPHYAEMSEATQAKLLAEHKEAAYNAAKVILFQHKPYTISPSGQSIDWQAIRAIGVAKAAGLIPGE